MVHTWHSTYFMSKSKVLYHAQIIPKILTTISSCELSCQSCSTVSAPSSTGSSTSLSSQWALMVTVSMNSWIDVWNHVNG